MAEPEEEEDAPVDVLVLANAERCLVEMGFSSSTVQRALTCVSQSVTAAVDYALQVEARNQAPTNPQLRRACAEMPARVDALAEQMERLSIGANSSETAPPVASRFRGPAAAAVMNGGVLCSEESRQPTARPESRPHPQTIMLLVEVVVALSGQTVFLRTLPSTTRMSVVREYMAQATKRPQQLLVAVRAHPHC